MENLPQVPPALPLRFTSVQHTYYAYLADGRRLCVTSAPLGSQHWPSVECEPAMMERLPGPDEQVTTRDAFVAAWNRATQALQTAVLEVVSHTPPAAVETDAFGHQPSDYKPLDTSDYFYPARRAVSLTQRDELKRLLPDGIPAEFDARLCLDIRHKHAVTYNEMEQVLAMIRQNAWEPLKAAV